MADEVKGSETAVGNGLDAVVPADEMARIEGAAKLLEDEVVPEEEVAAKAEAPEGEPEAPAAEAKPGEEAQPEESKTGLWARITQQDKELRQLRSQLKERVSLDDIRSIARKDPGKVLADLGIGIDQVIDALAASQGVHPERVEPKAPESKEIETLRQELASLRQEAAMTRQEAMVRSEVMRIDEAIKANPDRWEVVASQRDEGSLRLVLETAAELWKQTGEVPDYEIVLDSVEEHLAQEAKARLERLSGLKKFRRAEQPPQPRGPEAPARRAPVVNPNHPTAKLSELTADERMALAIKALEDGKVEE